MENKYVVGIDIGGQGSTIGIVDKRGEVILCRGGQGFLAPWDHREQQVYVDALCKALEEMFADEKIGGKENIAGIGIGAPSSSYLTGKIEKAPNLPPEWDNFEITKMVSKKINLDNVFLDNDANAAMLGEWAYGGAKDTNHCIMITLGTGLGSGIVAEGRLIRGKHGLGGELGHTRAYHCGDRICGCGRIDCLERYASATGMAFTAVQFVKQKQTGILYEKYKERIAEIRAELLDKNIKLNSEKDEEEIKNLKAQITELERKYELPISSKDVCDAAEKNDPLALEIFAFTGKILGESLANFVAFSDPNKIFLFGGLAKSGKYILEPTRKAMEVNLLKNYKGYDDEGNKKVDVYLSELNNNADAAILGASALVWEKIKSGN
ncbi:ROK family protein [Dysgonomonas sp. 511]|uniref:ROK family protein n=1 Tax=Dysgonomonas sp. 511 TaxID=2302930 RepID=UPI0013D183DC|nr:ROK family protein [Dysgonomonas sp. 511]NDV78390.1 ROK family protein [Dysgonomonas sp. 511]